MYPNVPAGYALVRQHMTSPGGDDHAFNIYGVHVTEDFANADLLAEALFTAWATGVMQGPSEDIIADNCAVVWNKDGTLLEGLFSGSAPGETEAASLPVQVAVLVRKVTGQIGRTNRGRFYIQGLTAAALDTSSANLTTDALANWQGYVTTFLDQVQTTVGNMAILHRDDALLPTTVNSLEVESLLATQRRRLRKAAHH
jgi:hypothetical protein